MAEEIFTSEAFDELLKVSRQKPLAFGFALGKKPEDSVLGFHKIKKPEQLAKLARKEDGTSTKTAHGTVTTKGKLITLDCEDYVPGMKKALKLAFKKQGRQLKVNIIPPDGVAVDPDDAVQDVDEEVERVADVADEGETGAEAADAPEAPPDAAPAFKARLAALLPQIKAAAGIPAGDQAILKAREAGVFAGKQDYDQANARLDEAETLLQGAGQSAAASPSIDDPERAAKLAEALKKLKPLVDKVINADPNRKGELHATMVQIADEIKGKQFDQARQNLVDFGTLLKSLAAQQPAPSASESEDRSAEFAARRATLEPRLLEAQKADREKSSKLLQVWDYAAQQAEAGNFGNAFKALERLETAVEGVLAAGPASTPGEGVVSAEVTRLELQQVRLAAVQGVGQLETVLRATNDQRAVAVADIVNRLAQNLPTELETILERYDAAVKAQESETIQALKGEIKASAKSWLQFLEQNADHIAGCESNPWNIPVKIVQPVRSSLSAILKVAG